MAPGAAGGFFGGLLTGLGSGLAAKKKQRHDDEIEQKNQLLSLVAKNIGTEEGQIDPKYGLPFAANIIAGHYNDLKGDTKGKGGKGKGGGIIGSLMGDPESLSALLLGIHGATSKSNASGPAGPTGLPSGGTAAAPGKASDVAQEDEQLPSSTQTATPARTSVFNTAADVEARDARRLEQKEAIQTKYAIERYKATTGAKPGKITADKDLTPDKDSPTGYSRVYRDETHGEAFRESAPAPASARPKTDTSPEGRLAKRYQDLAGYAEDGTPKMSDQRAHELAANELERRDRLAEKQKTQRTNAYLENATLGRQMRKEQLDNLVENEPTLKALKDAQLLNAQMLASIRMGDPAKLLAAAEKQVTQAEAKKGLIGTAWNDLFGDSHDEAVDKLLIGASGGADPDEIRAFVKNKTTRSVTPPKARVNPF